MDNKSQENPLVSIITVNFNQPEVTEDLLLSLRKVSYPNIEALVVDNGSKRNCSHLQERYPEVHFIQSRQNLGFAGGNNLGIRQAKGKYILLLNNDTEVDSHFLEPMLRLFEDIPKLGIVSPMLVFYDTGLVQYAGAKGINYFTGRGKKIGFKQAQETISPQARPTGLGHGAAMLFPKKLIDKVGYLPEIYFLYYEEHDWCEACKRAGYKVYFQGASKVYHKESVSVGKLNPLKTYYLNRNRLLFIQRNAHGLQKTCAIAFYLLLAFPKNLIKHTLKGEKEHALALKKVLRWHIKRKADSFKTLFNQKNFTSKSHERFKAKATGILPGKRD
jgi:GT2 family glycosyltransferase